MATAKSPNSATKAPRKPAAKRTAKPAVAKASAPKAATKAAAPKPVTAKAAAPKAATKAPARKPAAKAPAPRRRGRLISAIALGIIATGSAIALFGRRLLPQGNAEHEAPDLALDQPYPGPDGRAPAMFRPDPTADVPASEREGLRPATLTNSLATH